MILLIKPALLAGRWMLSGMGINEVMRFFKGSNAIPVTQESFGKMTLLIVILVAFTAYNILPFKKLWKAIK